MPHHGVAPPTLRIDGKRTVRLRRVVNTDELRFAEKGIDDHSRIHRIEPEKPREAHNLALQLLAAGDLHHRGEA